MADKKIDEIVYKRMKGDITKFAESLSPDEQLELVKMPSWLFARIYQAGAVAAIDTLRELREAE